LPPLRPAAALPALSDSPVTPPFFLLTAQPRTFLELSEWLLGLDLPDATRDAWAEEL